MRPRHSPEQTTSRSFTAIKRTFAQTVDMWTGLVLPGGSSSRARPHIHRFYDDEPAPHSFTFGSATPTHHHQFRTRFGQVDI